jgi:hypothetical protein
MSDWQARFHGEPGFHVGKFARLILYRESGYLAGGEFRSGKFGIRMALGATWGWPFPFHDPEECCFDKMLHYVLAALPSRVARELEIMLYETVQPLIFYCP